MVSPAGSKIAYLGNDENDNYSNLASLYIMNSDGSGKRMLAGDLPNSPSSVTWARDGSGLYFTMGVAGSSNVHFVTTNGSLKKITEGNQYNSGLSIAKN